MHKGKRAVKKKAAFLLYRIITIPAIGKLSLLQRNKSEDERN